MAICGCGSPAHCFQPAVAGGFIYGDLRGALSTHLALQALFTQSSPVHEPLLQAFPFPSTLGEVTLHLLSQACVFIYSSRGKWVFPPLLWSFPPTAAFTNFPTPGCWAVLLLPSPASLFIYSSVRDSPPPLFGTQGVPPYLLRVFVVVAVAVVYSGFFFLFFPGWGLVCPGAYAHLAQGCLWEYHVSLSSPCCLHFPKRSGS
jgi:hypothetical protein